MYKEVENIINKAIEAVLPEAAVKDALKNIPRDCKRIILVAIGKAAYRMGKCAFDELGDCISDGIIITKYEHAGENIPGIQICEAGHPIPDENTYFATEKALKLTENLKADDLVLFLVSGGGSALFEKPLISGEELEDITNQLLKSGANITEINTLRKRFSAVKGGKFAKHCEPARVFSIVLSDVLGDNLSAIASGPACPDNSSKEDAIIIADKYNITLSEYAKQLIHKEPVKSITNVDSFITGNVTKLCSATSELLTELGFETQIMTDSLDCEAKEAGRMFASIARMYCGKGKRAFIFGGETVVHVIGNGLGGRNQELALAAAWGIRDLDGVTIFSIGSDGTDGPTDAAGGVVDGQSINKLQQAGINYEEVLNNNDAYHALQAIDGLIITGPTGTNVNDVSVILIES